jgi:hypothetical protein
LHKADFCLGQAVVSAEVSVATPNHFGFTRTVDNVRVQRCKKTMMSTIFAMAVAALIFWAIPGTSEAAPIAPLAGVTVDDHSNLDAGVVGSSVLARPLGPPALPTGMAAISLLSRPGRPLRASRLNQLWPMSVDQKPILVRDWQATRAQRPVVPRFSICHYPHPPLPGSSGRHRTGMGG